MMPNRPKPPRTLQSPRKQAAYGAVLAVLQEELRRPTYAQLSRQLAGVVDPARSSVFDQIIF
jgi:hypothetical protein